MKNFIDKLGKKNLSIICIVLVVLIIIVPSGIKCAVNQESPAQLVADVFTPNTKQIVGKWQNDTAVTAYEFFDDGTYESYISTFSYKGKYEIKGNKITLKNTSLSGSVEYKFSINGDKLTLKLLKENGSNAEEKAKQSYSKVSTITTESLEDLIDSLKVDAVDSNE